MTSTNTIVANAMAAHGVARNFTQNSEFEVGDVVRFRDSVRSVPHDETYTVVKVSGNNVTIKGGRENGTSTEFADRLEIVENADTSVLRETAVNAKFDVGEGVLVARYHNNSIPVGKAGIIRYFDGDEYLVESGPYQGWYKESELIKKTSRSWRADIVRSGGTPRNAVVAKALNAQGYIDRFGLAVKDVKSKFKVSGSRWGGAGGEDIVDIHVRPDEDVDKVAKEAIDIFRRRGIAVKVAGSTPLHYMLGRPPKPASADWFRLIANSSVQKAMNAQAVCNASYSAALKAIMDAVKPYMDRRITDDTSWRYPALVISKLRDVCERAVMSAGRYDGKRPPHRVYDVECVKDGFKFSGNLIVSGLLHRDDPVDVSAFDEYDMILSLGYTGKAQVDAPGRLRR